MDHLIKKTVDEIIADLSDRRGLKWAWEDINEDIQDEIRETWSEIISNNVA